MHAKREIRDNLPSCPHLALERTLWMDGVIHVAGVDEAGRGAWAGPLVAASVLLPPSRDDLAQALTGVTDSKCLSPRRRETLFPIITRVALAIGVGQASPTRIDRYGLMAATRLAMVRAVEALVIVPEHLLIDAVDLRQKVNIPQQAMFFGDSISLSVAAASIIAKVTRDRIMCQLDSLYPHYGFAKHKGYGTVAHRAALAKHKPTPIHRRSFKPIAALVDQHPARA